MLQPGGELWRWESAMLLVATGAMALTRIWTRVLTRTDGPNTIAPAPSPKSTQVERSSQSTTRDKSSTPMTITCFAVPQRMN